MQLGCRAVVVSDAMKAGDAELARLIAAASAAVPTKGSAMNGPRRADLPERPVSTVRKTLLVFTIPDDNLSPNRAR